LDFKVLSPKDEASYSYAGSALATRIRTCVFFDLGGGSLEMVYAEGFRIKRVLSLPLGALRLTYAYGRGDETFSKKGYERMSERIRVLLPSRDELGIRGDAKLIGVGGNLRALARYHQERTRYPFEKVHNYAMSVESIDSITRKLSKTSRNKIAKINAIGGSRASTIVAGTCVVRNIMKKLGFREILISTHGLREGTLAMYLFDRRGFASGAIGPDQIQDHLQYSEEISDAQSENLRSLSTSGVVDEAESRILDASLRLGYLPSTIGLQSLFFLSMDSDSWLSHREQLMMAISLVCAKNENAGERLYSRYEMLLKRKQWRRVRRIAVAGKLLRLLQRMGAHLRVVPLADRIELRIRGQGPFIPGNILRDTVREFEDSFGLRTTYLVDADSDHDDSSVIQRAATPSVIRHNPRLRK
jgi:exopolyphosphatase/guanosine-5'-triphosphate,3'-diphosphate pyrophosphatase